MRETKGNRSVAQVPVDWHSD